MRADRQTRLRRALVVVSALLALWAAILAATGGIDLRYAGVRFSSRAPRNPLLLALAAAVAALALAPAPRLRTAVHDWRWLLGAVSSRLLPVWTRLATLEATLVQRTPGAVAPIVAAAIAIGVIVVGFMEGALVAAGADAWGYVSQADLWLDGTLRLQQPLMRELSARIPPGLMAPLAYTASSTRMDLVPAVGPGLPMLMALFAGAGGREAVFYVVPLLAGVAVMATYLIGARVSNRWAGAGAAALLASSPAFLFQLTSSPMSDIPATAWWGLALAAMLGRTRGAALCCGLATSAAVLTRPNLALLAALPGVVLLLRGMREPRSWRRLELVTIYTAAIAPAAATIAALNTFWHGSPLSTGYGATADLFSLANVGPNLARYPRWLVESQTPVILLALAAPFVRSYRTHAMPLLAFAFVVLATYLVYIPFDAWWFLRFLLPSYPALLALCAAVIAAMAVRLPRGTRLALPVIVIALAAWHGVTYAQQRTTFDSEGEYKYKIAGLYVAEHLPTRAVLFTMQHSGSARYYSGRTTLRWDLTPVEHLEWAIAEIQRHGYAPFALVEDWEEELWRQQLAGRVTLPALSRAPLATLPLGNVRVYDLRSP